MPTPPEFETITDDQLLASVRKLVARTNTALADLLAHLAEVEARGIHRLRACATLYTYCVYELRMSEDEAYRRSKAARLVRQFPELFERIATGEIHLTGLLLLGPHLDCEQRGEILDCARFRSKREIQELVSRIDPKPEVPPLVEPIGPAPAGPATHRRFVASLAGPVRSLPVGERPADWIEDEDEGDVAAAGDTGSDSSERGGEHAAPESVFMAPRDCADEARSSPPWGSPVRFKVQFTATEEYVNTMKEALDLLSHEMSARDIAEVHARAMQALVAELRKKKRAATDRPRRATASRFANAANAASRHISAEVCRQVWTRDEGRCRYADCEGRRCAETSRLEIHHRVPYAKGGLNNAENLELRCHAHNELAAEQDFGREHIARMKGELPANVPRWRGSKQGAGRLAPGSVRSPPVSEKNRRGSVA